MQTTRPSVQPQSPARPFPLDLAATPYSYIERPNLTLVSLIDEHVLRGKPDAAILDVGCGCGANARAIREHSSTARIHGIEPSSHAALLARKACESVHHGELASWRPPGIDFDAVVLSDVLEHVADPVAFLRTLTGTKQLERALFIVSIPNYAVWHNRVRTLLGRFEYYWSGLYDRTHLRFFTRSSIRDLLDYVGFAVLATHSTPSFAQSAVPLVRGLFERDVAEGNHLAIANSRLYQIYERYLEPIESAVCELWPELLAFQIVSVARLRSPREQSGQPVSHIRRD
jgi:cyclopropane fatty-acyl-phospholipid synthase-like methyltransferase